MTVAICAVVGVIVLIVILSSGEKKKRQEYVSDELTGDTPIEKGPLPPKEIRKPAPDISPEIIERARQIVDEMDPDREAGLAAYEEAMRAKQRNDLETWKAKLNEAKEFFLNIRDKWNDEVIGDIEGELPPNCDWDAEEVANYHLGKEGEKVSKALKTLAAIKKQLGLR